MVDRNHATLPDLARPLLDPKFGADKTSQIPTTYVLGSSNCLIVVDNNAMGSRILGTCCILGVPMDKVLVLDLRTAFHTGAIGQSQANRS